MKRYKLSQFTKGWFMGAFQPTIFYTNAFEVAIKYHTAGENYPAHKQRIATEYNVLISGEMSIGKEAFKPNDIFVIPPGEVAKPVFQSDCIVVCVKVPSIASDRVVTE